MPRNIYPQPFVIHPPDDLLRQYPDLQRMASALASLYAERQVVVSDEHLQAMGGALWHTLGASVQSDFDAARANAGAAILPIVIESAAADVQHLPWETLHHPALGFLGKHPAFTLTRRIAAREPQAKCDKGPLKVLLFTSLPDDVDADAERGRLNVEEEQAQVQEALAPWIAQGLVKLEMPDDGRFSTFKELLKANPHVVFLSGHGKFHHAPHTGEKPFGVFLFESETGAGEEIRDDEIASALVGTGAQAVILSACESGKAAPNAGASDALTNGLMQRISAQGIPHVIGMRETILDRAGIQFARALCDELAQRERIDFALQAARIAIQTPLKDSSTRSSLRSESAQSAAAELSLGQWCLPMLVSANPQTPLIDWDFAATPVKPRNIARALNNVSMPARFIGRRAEMRRYKKDLADGKIRKLLITGPGGQGKTSLAGKLALDLEQAQGFRIFAWSTRPEQPWRDFEFRELELALDHDHADKFNRFLGRAPSDRARADFLSALLMEQFDGRILFFFDNLESLQDADTLQVKDAAVRAWLDCLQAKTDARLIATSRWQLPAWQGETLPLAHASYGDFLQMAQGWLPQSFLAREARGRLRRVYDVLGGNCRGLDFLASALKTLPNADEEDAFINALARTKSELQTNMAIEMIVSHLPPEAKAFLQRLPAYHEPVPLEGIIKLGLDLPQPDALMERLLNVSLLEARYEPRWDVTEFQCAPLVTDWLASREQGLIDNAPRWLNDAADYHLYLFAQERRTLPQAIAAHHALRRAGRDAEADRLTLDAIVGPLTRAGFYTTLLIEWLPRICESPDLKTRAEALGQTGKLHLHLGNFDDALPYLKQSLAIRQQIGDKAGEGTTLNNISALYHAQGDYETALTYLKQSLAISQQIGDLQGQGTTLNNISALYHAQGDYETALTYLKQSLAIWQQIGDKAGEGATLNNISQIYDAQGDYATALTYLKQSLAIRQQIGDKAGEGTTLNNISQIFKAQGDYATALTYLKQSLAIRQQIGDKAGEGTTLGNIAALYHAQGDYEASLSYMKQSLVLFQQIGDKAGEGTMLNNIATAHHAQGDYATALTYLKQSLAIRQQIGDLRGQGATLNNISQIYDAQGDYETALTYLKQSLAIRQQIGDIKGESVTLNNISQILQAQGDFETALEYSQRDLAICQKIGDRAGMCVTLFNMGHMYARENQMQEAVSAWVTVYVIAKQINEYQVLQALSQLAPQLGMPEGLEGWEMLARRMKDEGCRIVIARTVFVRSNPQTAMWTPKAASSQTTLLAMTRGCDLKP
ncbi:MAG: tetratricopeptide repeat protein [Chloroflexota bacterium]